MRRPALAALATLALASALGACGSQDNSVQSSNASADVKIGSQLFVDRCSGCHTLSVVGAEGGATKVRDRERVDGPNFDVRKECVADVLYAIRNGGYSGAIMPENIVVGKQADDVAKFLEQYSGLKRKPTAGTLARNCPGS
ncbi:MAG: cytochrome c [Solirubrobacterales bacterium]|nr:cytochrome c [Solirubrobacterales bacterium]